MAFLPGAFLSNIKLKDGLAKPCRFEVILPIPNYINSFIGNSVLERLLDLPNTIVADITNVITDAFSKNTQDEYSKTANPSISRYLALQCEAAELPGKTLATADVKIYGPSFKVPYQTQYTDTTLTFLCTNEFYERKLFERWMDCIMPYDTNNLRFPKDERTRYLTNIQVIQYDDLIKKIFIIELMDSFPIGIASQQLSWSDDNFHRLSVQFAFQKYRVIYEGGYDIIGAATNILGNKFTQYISNKLTPLNNISGKIFNAVT
jgi:hypothetical protein